MIAVQPDSNIPCTLLVLDDNQAECDSMVLLLEAYGYRAQGLGDIETLLQYDFKPDHAYCLLADVGGRLNTCHPLHKFLDDNPTLPFIVMSCTSDVNLAVFYTRMGAVSFLQKPIPRDMLMQAIGDGIKLSRLIYAYQRQRQAFESRLKKLSPREHEVLNLVIEGRSSSQIACDLGLSIKTVSLHRTNIMNKLQANGVVQLVRMITPAPMPGPRKTWPGYIHD